MSKQLKDVTDELNSSKSLLGTGHVSEEDKKDVEDSIHELEEFASVAQATITKLHRTVEDAKTAYSSVLAYFCQDSSLKSEDFFAFVINFLDALESTHRAQEEKREREKNKKKKEGEMTAIKKRVVKEEEVKEEEVKEASSVENVQVVSQVENTQGSSQVENTQTLLQVENTPTSSQTESAQTPSQTPHPQDPQTMSVEGNASLASLFDQNMPN